MHLQMPAAQTDRSLGQTIALVEAQPRAALVAALSSAGYNVQSYSHPLQALEGIVDKPVAVALVAHDLPWMSGTALVRTLRDSYKVREVLLMDNDMSEDAILARVRSAAPIETPDPRQVERARKQQQQVEAANSNGRTGRRILIRTARPR